MQRLKKAEEMAFIVKEEGVLDQGLQVYLGSVPDGQRQEMKNVLDRHFDHEDIKIRAIPILAEIFTLEEMKQNLQSSRRNSPTV